MSLLNRTAKTALTAVLTLAPLMAAPAASKAAGATNRFFSHNIRSLAVPVTVSFSPTNPGLPINPAFCGLSYEKSQLTGSLFVSNNISLINMLGQIAPAVLRLGGSTVDT
ncbi:MAG: hypothetical protein ACTHLW_21230, partial [Verrucomicrobiota bacterium]